MLLIFTSISFLSCVDDGIDCTLEQNANKTLIVYMGGDNNLSDETAQKIEAIQRYVASDIQFAKGSDRRVEILIYQDPASSSGKLPKLWRAKYGELKPEDLKTYSNSNSASAALFSRVLEDYKHYAPADRYGLIVFSHASGWLPQGTLNNPNRSDTRSVVVDGISEMGINDFTSTIYAC